MNLYNAACKKKESSLDSYKKEVKISIESVKKRISENKKRKYFGFNDYTLGRIVLEIEESVKGSLNIRDISGLEIDKPPLHIESDFAIKCFDLAKQLVREPEKLAEEIAQILNQNRSGFTERAFFSGPFVNLNVRKEKFYADVLSEISEMGGRYGESDINAKKVAIVDYSSPNIAKPIGVGHLRSTIIGQAISNLYQKTGFSVIRDNHLGDWGTQIGSLICAMELWGGMKNKEKNIKELKDLYVKFHKSSEENLEMKNRARVIFNQLERGDSGLLNIWKELRDLSIAEFEKTYKQLGVFFDTYIGESYFNNRARRLVADCLGKGFCKKDFETKAVIVGSLGGLPTFLLRKQDGSSLYITRDLAGLKFRVKVFKPDLVSYVVGKEQELYFEQLFRLGRVMGYLPPEVEVRHIDFGMVLVGGKKCRPGGDFNRAARSYRAINRQSKKNAF